MIIKIGTDRFWVKSSNIERWPEILKELPEQIDCKSKYGIAKDYLHYKADTSGRIVNADEVYGLFGAEKSGDSYTIAGCNLIKQCSGGYELTDSGISLMHSYQDNGSWEKLLAEQILKFSIRVRSIWAALVNGGFLVIQNSFSRVLSSEYIDCEGEKYYIFSSDSERVNINCLMRRHPEMALGDFWREELGVEKDEVIELHGVNKEYPSLGSMSTYIKIPLLLFEYLKWLKKDDRGYYVVNKSVFKHDVSEATYRSFLMNGEVDELDILKELINQSTDARGFFPVGIVGSVFKSKVAEEDERTEEQWIDHFFIKGTNDGRFKITDNEQGQPRHGRGLLGKKEYQLIKLEFGRQEI